MIGIQQGNAMKRFTISACIALLAGASAHAAPLFFDDFDSNPTGPNLVPAGWSVTSGAVDIVGPGYFPEICSIDGDRCIDLDGSRNAAGRMQTATGFALTAGANFTLSFDYSWNYFNQQFPNTMTFGVGGFSQSLTTSGTRSQLPTPYTSLSFSFTGDGSTGSIFFDHQGGVNGGIVIDNVRLVGAEASPVPLPAGLPLLLAGLGGLALLRRRAAL